MADEMKAAPKADDAPDVEQKVSWLGARLREKSTYAGLTVVVSLLLPFFAKFLPQLAGADPSQIAGYLSAIGIATGGLIAIVAPDKGAKALLGFLVVGAALALALPAQAAPQRDIGALTPQAVAGKIQKLAKPDLSYAMKLATAAGTVQSKVRLQCYQAISDALPTPPADATMPAAPHVITDIEQLAELIDALQPTSPLFVNCGGAAQLAGQSVLQFINGVVTGVAGAAVLISK